MAYSEKKKAKIKVEYESGMTTKIAICHKWRMSANTLKKFADKDGWGFGVNDNKVTRKITQKAEERLTEKYTRKLEDFTIEHIEAMDEVGRLTRKSLERLSLAVEKEDNEGESNQMSKVHAEAIFSQQKILKISSETLSIIYADKRKALGLDKEKPDEGKTADAIEDRINALMDSHGIE